MSQVPQGSSAVGMDTQDLSSSLSAHRCGLQSLPFLDSQHRIQKVGDGTWPLFSPGKNSCEVTSQLRGGGGVVGDSRSVSQATNPFPFPFNTHFFLSFIPFFSSPSSVLSLVYLVCDKIYSKLTSPGPGMWLRKQTDPYEFKTILVR